MRLPTNMFILRVTVPFSFLLTALTAQTPFFVNGQTGADVPANGGSATAAWKTIGYALANVPAQTASTAAVVYIEGNQTYSATTNGELFPISMAYNVTLEGGVAGHGRSPVIDIPAGETGVFFPAFVAFNRSEAGVRYLEFENGNYGLRMGGLVGTPHRPTIRNCAFRNQAVAAVLLANNGDGVDDPRFYQTRMTGPGVGIAALVATPNATVAPDVEECTFRDLATAIDLDADRGLGPVLPGVSLAGGSYRACQFENCGIGIDVRTVGGNTIFSFAVTRCRMSDCGVGVTMYPYLATASPDCSVTESVFVNCGVGVDVDVPAMWHGGVTLDVASSSFFACGTAVKCFGDWGNSIIFDFTDSTIDGGSVGLDLRQIFDAGAIFATVERSRIRGCQTGIDTYVDNLASQLQILSSTISQCSGSAIRYYGYPGPFGGNSSMRLDHVTLADNAVGIEIDQSRHTTTVTTVNSSIFAGNAQDLMAPPSLIVDHSCLQQVTWPGVGNLNTTDPQLVRPFYKLAPTSPCIDAGVAITGSPTSDYEGDPRASVGVLGGPADPDMGADEYVYSGSVRAYGTGGFGTSGSAPRFSLASRSAPIGGTLQVDLADAFLPDLNLAANFAILSLGWRDDSGALPFDLAQFGMAGSFLLNDFIASFPLQPVAANGTASQSHVLPNQMALVGQSFTHQWFALLPGSYGVVSSDGLRVTIGQ